MNKTFSRTIISLALLANAPAIAAGEPEKTIVPDSISNFYSNIDLKTTIASKKNAVACSAEQCVLNREFDALVKQQGERLAAIAYSNYPDLTKKVANFSFTVAEKIEPGLASNKQGDIVIFRGIQSLELTENAVTFLIAREMGHVIAGHHTSNASTKIMYSLLASLFFPAAALVGIGNTAAQASSVTSVLTSAASTATSYIGSEAAISKIKPTQLNEADNIGVNLSAQLTELDLISLYSELLMEDPKRGGWLKDLQASALYLQDMSEKKQDKESASSH